MNIKTIALPSMFAITSVLMCSCGYIDENVYERIHYQGNRCLVRSILHESGIFGFSDFGSNYQLLCNNGDDLSVYYVFDLFSANADFIISTPDGYDQNGGAESIQFQFCEWSVSDDFMSFLPQLSTDLTEKFGESPALLSAVLNDEMCRPGWRMD